MSIIKVFGAVPFIIFGICVIINNYLINKQFVEKTINAISYLKTQLEKVYNRIERMEDENKRKYTEFYSRLSSMENGFGHPDIVIDEKKLK